jgi:hypothetical protein
MLGNLGNGSNQDQRKDKQRPLDRMRNFSYATICIEILDQLARATKMTSSMLYDSKYPSVIYTSIFLHNGAHAKGTWTRDVLPLATAHAAARSTQYPFFFFQELSRRQKQPADSLEEQIHAFSGMLDVSIRLIIHTMCHLLLIKALPLGRGYHKKS